MSHSYLLVMAGGALGALLRLLSYELFKWLNIITFPFATFLINLSGSFFFGVIAAFIAGSAHELSLKLFFLTGCLGAFTTFSAFSFEVLQLLQQGSWKMAIFYSLLSVVCCVVGVFLGHATVKILIPLSS